MIQQKATAKSEAKVTKIKKTGQIRLVLLIKAYNTACFDGNRTSL
jgi:hypothetical protein